MSEIVDVYDINGNKLNKTIERNQDKLNPGEYRMGSLAFITDKKDNFLIQQRAFTKKILPGKWAITGGAALSGEDKTQCVVREINEELGIKITPKNLKFLMLYIEETGDVLVNIFVAYINRKTKITRQTNEVEQIKWVSRQELLKLHKSGDFIQPRLDELLSKIR